MIDYISMRPQSCHTDAVLAGNDVCKGLRCIAKTRVNARSRLQLRAVICTCRLVYRAVWFLRHIRSSVANARRRQIYIIWHCDFCHQSEMSIYMHVTSLADAQQN